MTDINQAIMLAVFAARKVKRSVEEMNSWVDDHFDVKYGVTEDIEALERAIKALKEVVDQNTREST
jgi:hypothetical protein